LIRFPKKIKGREDRLSITIPRNISREYGLEPGDDVKITLTDKPKNPTFEIQFVKTISKCGLSGGTLLYVPKRVVHKHNLQRNMSVWVTVEEAF